MFEIFSHIPEILEFGTKSCLLVLISLLLVKVVFSRSSASFRFGVLVSSSICIVLLLFLSVVGINLGLGLGVTWGHFELPESSQVWLWWLIAVWGTGAAMFVLLGLLRFTVGEVTCWRAKSLKLSSEDLAISEGYPVIASEHCDSPYTQGVIWPTIFVPEDFPGWEKTLRDHVILHEVSHIKRGDLVWTQFFLFCLSCIWFFPPAWFHWFESRVEQERCCDDSVIRTGVNPVEYCETLISICSNPPPRVQGQDVKSHFGMGLTKSIISKSVRKLDSLASVRFLSRRILAAIDRDVSRASLSRFQWGLLTAFVFGMTAFLQSFHVDFFVRHSFTEKVIEVWICQSEGDAEQFIDDGKMNLADTDLEFNFDKEAGRHQLVGFRFDSVNIPVGARVKEAHLVLVRDTPDCDEMNLRIEFQLHPNPPPFSLTSNDISSRLCRGNPAVFWNQNCEFDAWTSDGHRGFFGTLVSPSLAKELQEIIDLPEWLEGNAVTILVSSYPRTAHSTASVSTVASDRGEECLVPKLVVRYQVDSQPVEQ